MSKLFRALTLVFIFSILVKFIDIFRGLVISSVFGVSNHADIYLGLITIPDSILVIAGFDSIKGVVNSEYSSLYSKGISDELWNSYSNLIKIVFFSSLFVTLILLLNRSLLINILFPGFSEEKKLLAISISIIIIPILFFKALMGVFNAVLNSRKKFYSPVILSSLISIFILLSILLPYYKNELLYNLSIGNLAGNIAICIGFLVIIYRMGGGIRFQKIKIDKVTKSVLKSCSAIFILVFCNQLYLSSKNFFASYCGEGAVSSLNYSGTITMVISTLIFSSVFSVLVSDLSSGFAVEKRDFTRKMFMDTFLSLLFIIIPIVSFLSIYRNGVLEVLFLRGNFDKIGIEKTLAPFLWESFGLISFIVYIIPIAFFLAKKDYKLLTIIGCPIFILGIGLNFILSKLFGYVGISAGSFFVHIIFGIILIFYSRKTIGKLKKYSRQISLIFLSGIIVSFALFSLKNLVFDKFSQTNLLQLIIVLAVNILICIILYYLVTYLFKVNYALKWGNKFLTSRRNA